MGGDGGSIPKRIDLVRTGGYKFARNLGGMGYSPNTQAKCATEQYSEQQIRALRWQTCALSQEPLCAPIVACKIGLLYNKEAVLKYILSKRTTNSMAHVKKLKDTREINFKYDDSKTRFLCPITLTELNASNRGILLWKCGCCISEKALRQLVGTNTKNEHCETQVCPNCGGEFLFNSSVFNGKLTDFGGDLVPLVPDLTQEGQIRARLKQQLSN